PSPRSCRTLRQQAAEIGTAWLMRDEVAGVRDRRHRSLLHEDEALADLLEDFEVETLVGVDAEEHQPSLRAQPAEEVEHEADIAVLRVELRLVEQVHDGIGAAGALQERVWHPGAEMPDLIGLVVVDR